MKSSAAKLGAWLASALVIGMSATLIVRTVWLMDRGFDFTDQSFYLMLAQRPTEYDFVYGLFGYGLHPLYLLVDGVVASMQRVGGLILVALGAAAGIIAMRKAKVDWRHFAAPAQIIAVSAASSLIYYLHWIPTPSYNWLLSVAGLTLFAAILLLHCENGGTFSAVVVAITALLVTLTRPQNALGYGAIYLAAILFAVPTKKSRLIQIARAGCFVAVVFAIAAIVSPIGIIVEQIKEYIGIFGTSHPIQFSFVDQQLDFVRSSWLWFVSGFMFVAAVFVRWRDRYPSKIVVIAFIASASVILLAAVFGKSPEPLSFRIGPKAGVVAFCALSFACFRKDADLRLIILLGTTALIPWAATLGGATVVRAQLSYFSGMWIFIALAGISIAARMNLVVVTAASCMGLWETFSAIETGLSAPYRLAAPIDMQLVPTPIGRHSVGHLENSGVPEFVRV